MAHFNGGSCGRVPQVDAMTLTCATTAEPTVNKPFIASVEIPPGVAESVVGGLSNTS